MALDLAVATEGPTKRRLSRHLPRHGIAVHGVSVGGHVYELDRTDADDGTIDVDVGFVYPPRVPAAGVVDARLDVPWVNDREDILTTRYKAGVLARLAEADIPIPRSVSVASPVDQDEVVDTFRSFDGPAVLKPNSTTRGVGHVLVEDVDSLRGVVDYFELIQAFPATEDRTFLMQAYVDGARDCRLTLIDGQVAGAVERRREPSSDGWVKNVHRGADAVAIDPPAALVETAEAVARELDIAFLGVDLLLTDEGPLVLEVNGRPTIDRVEKYPPTFYDRLAALITRTADVS